ncbi:MAG: GHKL domain-containing protein [Ruminococcus sp.]|nr:GHKL domain-containing protein [Ruminococcus sp.]
MTETILYLISNAVHLYAVFMLFKAVLGESRLSPLTEKLTYVAYYAVNCSVYLFTDSSLLNLISNLVPMLIIMLQYRRPLRTMVFLTLALAAVGMMIDWIVSVIAGSSILATSNTLQSIAFLGLAFVFRALFVKDESGIGISTEAFLPILSIFTTIVIAVMIGPDIDIKGLFIAASLLIIDLLMIYTYDKLIDKMRLQITLKSIENANKTYRDQLEIMNISQSKLRFLRHDMKNHLAVLSHLIQSNEPSQALEYIGRMNESLSAGTSFISTGVPELDGLINYKIALANERGIAFRCELAFPEQTGIDVFDLTALLGNLLDNALDASKRAQSPQIELTAGVKRGYLSIIVSNRIDSSVLESNPKLMTTKGDKLSHGLGTRSVRQICEKYDGSLDHYERDGLFVADILLKIPNRN